MTPDSVLLYSEVSVCLSHHQKSLSLQYMETNTHGDPQLDKGQRGRVLGALSTNLNGVSLSVPPSRVQGALWKRRQTDCKSQRGWTAPGKWCLPDTAGLTPMGTLTETVAAHTGPAQGPDGGSQCRHGAVDTISHP